MKTNLVNSIFQKYFWKMFFKSFLIIFLLWCFTIGIRMFIRQEHSTLLSLSLFTLSTLSSLVPYLCIIAMQLSIIEMSRAKELPLLTLLGITRSKIFIYFKETLLILCLFMFIFEGFIKPYIKKSLKHPAVHINDRFFEIAPQGKTLNVADWSYNKTSPNQEVLVKSAQNKQTVLLASNFSFNHNSDKAEIIAQHSIFWPNFQNPHQKIMSQNLSIPIPLDINLKNKPERNFKELYYEASRKSLHKILLIIRESLAPISLLFLGISLGYFSCIYGNSKGFLFTLCLIFFIYFPLNILGKKLNYNSTLQDFFIIFSPHLITVIISALIFKFTAKKGGIT